MEASFVEKPTIRKVFEAVADGTVDAGVVPVENSLEGTVGVTLDMLRMLDVRICGEIEEPIRHNLIVKPGVRRQDIRVIVSHPQALSQCASYLERNFPRAVLREAASTAAAVKSLRKLKNAAAIGTELAAEIYGMEILERNIGGENRNYTRFLVIALEDCPPTGKDKTSLLFSVKDRPGALYHALKPFARRRINLTKIESRPSKDEPWTYVFFTEFEGHRQNAKCARAIEELKKVCEYVKVLGSYPCTVQPAAFKAQ